MATTNSWQERLKEAANFYQSLPVNQKLDGMSTYLRERFDVTDPLVVKSSILRIRKQLADPGSWEYEVARIEEEMIRLCERHDDIPICVSIGEWAENLTEDARQYFEEEYPMVDKIGMKVRNILGSYGEGTITRYGIVRANQNAYVVNTDPFDEKTMHDYKTHRPKQEKFEAAQEYSDAIREYDRQEVGRQANILANAEMLSVE